MKQKVHKWSNRCSDPYTQMPVKWLITSLGQPCPMPSAMMFCYLGNTDMHRDSSRKMWVYKTQSVIKFKQWPLLGKVLPTETNIWILINVNGLMSDHLLKHWGQCFLRTGLATKRACRMRESSSLSWSLVSGQEKAQMVCLTLCLKISLRSWIFTAKFQVWNAIKRC